MDYIKVDTSTMKTTSAVDTVYNYNELLSKKAGIENYKQFMIAQWNVQIAEVDKLIAEAIKLGLKEAVVALK